MLCNAVWYIFQLATYRIVALTEAANVLVIELQYL